MNIQIHAQDITLTEGLRDYVTRRLAYALIHGQEMVSRIIVRLSDINGPRGGLDKRCGIEILLKGAPAVTIEDTEADIHVAIDRAAERAGRTLDRRLSRRHEFPMSSISRQHSLTAETE